MVAAAVGDWMPRHFGDRRVYEVEIREGNRQHPDVETWREEVRTVAVRQVSDGILIERTVKLLEGTAPGRSVAKWCPTANILVRGNCLYFEYGGEVGEPPDVCFPLREGAVWGDVKDGRGHWRVAGFERERGWRLEAHLASGDDNSVWFQKQVGVAATRTLHHGTYYEKRVRLLSFQSGE